MTDEVFKMCLCATTGYKLIDELPLHKVINHYTSLANINGAWYGQCLWCKKAKIMINDEAKTWACVGCDMQGDVFDFMSLKFSDKYHEMARALIYLSKNK